MDPKVCGKLLTHHRRGYGVDVEALRDRCPLRRSSEKAPRWDLVDTESYGGGIRVLAQYLIIWWYVGIYRRKEYVGGETTHLVASSFVSRRRVQVFWIMFGEKITFPKVSFRLDSD